MGFVQAKCPNCSGFLAVDSTHDAAVCQFCGTPFIVEKAINNFNITNNIENMNVVVKTSEHEIENLGFGNPDFRIKYYEGNFGQKFTLNECRLERYNTGNLYFLPDGIHIQQLDKYNAVVKNMTAKYSNVSVEIKTTRLNKMTYPVSQLIISTPSFAICIDYVTAEQVGEIWVNKLPLYKKMMKKTLDKVDEVQSDPATNEYRNTAQKACLIMEKFKDNGVQVLS